MENNRNKRRGTLVNLSLVALDRLQNAFEGEAVRVGITSEEDVVKLCKDARKELYQELYIAKIDRSIEELDAGRGVVKTIDELEAMANESKL